MSVSESSVAEHSHGQVNNRYLTINNEKSHCRWNLCGWGLFDLKCYLCQVVMQQDFNDTQVSRIALYNVVHNNLSFCVWFVNSPQEPHLSLAVDYQPTWLLLQQCLHRLPTLPPVTLQVFCPWLMPPRAALVSVVYKHDHLIPLQHHRHLPQIMGLHPQCILLMKLWPMELVMDLAWQPSWHSH